MTINQTDAIEDALNGKRSLSIGYECGIEKAEEGATLRESGLTAKTMKSKTL
jgi:hypothetical protein